MAWYRCGGGGLPAGLQSDMDTVLNKKFSTSTTYPPTDWPDTVNLMGPLPEKTASSASVCSFSDGADDVPMKSVIAHIAPTLTGTNAVNMVQTGKNLLPNEMTDGQTGGLTYTKNSDGSISCVGKVTNVNSTRVIATNIKLPVGSYVLSGGNSSIRLRCTIYDKDGTYTARNDTGNGVTVSVIATTDYLEFRILARTLNEEVNTIVYPQFETGSTATAYEPYKAPTTYTANLGRTVYGGQADIVSGQGIEEREKVEFDGSDDENWSLVATGTYRYSFVSNNFIKTNTMYTDILCDTIEVKNTSENVDGGITCRGTSYSSRIFYIFFPISNSEGVNDLTTFKAWLNNNPCSIVYPPSTPTDFTFDGQEIPSLLGVNNLWHDAGETECTYRADISLALQAINGGRGLMMMRPTEPEETEETEETEGLENELNR